MLGHALEKTSASGRSGCRGSLIEALDLRANTQPLRVPQVSGGTQSYDVCAYAFHLASCSS